MVFSFFVYGLWFMLLSLFYISIIHATKSSSVYMASLTCCFKWLGYIKVKGEKMEVKRQEQKCYPVALL